MFKTGKRLQKIRVYSEEFKRSRIKEYEKGIFSVREMSILYGISQQTIYRWIYKYSTYNQKGLRIVEMEKSSKQKVDDLQNRIKELEQIVGQKQLNIDYLEKMIEIAKDDFDIDIKKNFDTPQSSTSKKTKKRKA
jgi:transposase